MKKAIYTLVLALTVGTIYSQSALEIRYNTLESGTAFLINTKTKKVDTLMIDDGLLIFKNKIYYPTLYYLVVEGYNDTRPLSLILSDEKTEVEFDFFKKIIDGENIKDAYPNHPKFKKDPNDNLAFYEFQLGWMNFYDSIKSLSTSDSKELLEMRKELYHTFLSHCETIIKDNSDKYVSAVIIEYLLRNNLLQLETIQAYYDHLAPEVKESFFGIKIGEKAGDLGKLSPGNSAPEFEFVDINDQRYNLANLKGKKVLLHFWSSSCAPCIKEAPDLIRLSEEYKNRLVTINISLDTDKEKWKRGIDRAGIGEMNNVCDYNATRSKTVRDYSINVIPTYFLIDEDAKIILKGTLNQVSEEIRKSSL